MRFPEGRVRGADPARDLPSQPDERAQRDLAALLAEPVPYASPAHRPVAVQRAPILATVVVAIVVLAVTAAVLGLPHGRADVAATPAVSTPEVTSPVSTGCHPASVLPFRCGTYLLTYSRGDRLGDPRKVALEIGVTARTGGLLLRARAACFRAEIPVRLVGERLVPAGGAVFGRNGCSGGSPRRGDALVDFFTGSHRIDATSGTLAMDEQSSMVTFDYEGSAAIGEKQPLPRNVLPCTDASVAPFTCATYRSTAGTGALAFLGTDRYRLDFHHVNGVLTASFDGGFNGSSAEMQLDGDTAVLSGGAGTAMGCSGPVCAALQAHDAAIQKFFSGILTWSQEGDRVTFTSRDGASSATFRR